MCKNLWLIHPIYSPNLSICSLCGSNCRSHVESDAIFEWQFSVTWSYSDLLSNQRMNGEVEFKQLNDDDKKWYKDKMTKLGTHTCCQLTSGRRQILMAFCGVPRYSICVYLINSPSPDTREAPKAIKSSEGYAYFAVGVCWRSACY